MNDHRTIHNSQNVGAQMSINRKTIKPESIYPLHCKRNEALIHTTKWTNIQNYKLNERNQSQKTIFYINIECPEHIYP